MVYCIIQKSFFYGISHLLLKVLFVAIIQAISREKCLFFSKILKYNALLVKKTSVANHKYFLSKRRFIQLGYTIFFWSGKNIVELFRAFDARGNLKDQ